MVAFLKYLNTIPWPITIRHFVALGPLSKELGQTLRSAEDWHVLREKHPHYRIPEDRATWLRELTMQKDGQDAHLLKRVGALAALIKKEDIKTLYSIGSGGGVFEYFLKQKIPGLVVVVSEPTERGVERLKKVFLEADRIEKLDALALSTWTRIGEDQQGLVFIYRNEHEFTDEEWKRMLDMMYVARVERIYLGLMYLLTARAYSQMKIRNLMRRLRGEPLVFAGYVRNYAAFRRFWRHKYIAQETPFPGCRGFYLTRV